MFFKINLTSLSTWQRYDLSDDVKVRMTTQKMHNLNIFVLNKINELKIVKIINRQKTKDLRKISKKLMGDFVNEQKKR